MECTGKEATFDLDEDGQTESTRPTDIRGATGDAKVSLAQDSDGENPHSGDVRQIKRKRRAQHDGSKKLKKSQTHIQRVNDQQEHNSAQVLPLHIIPGTIASEPTMAPSSLVRLVKPYLYTFRSNAKFRWFGRTILDVYVSEFGSYPESYYRTAIQQGRIRVGNEKVDVAYTIRSNDVLTHTVHRHEPAVAVSQPQAPFVKVVANSETWLVVDKPGTMPVHPSGAYHLNSLLPILENTYGKLYPIHRLDRLTSGLVILGKNPEVARQLGKAIKERDSCTKLYIARVRGRFPFNCASHVPNLSSHKSYRPRYGEWSVLQDMDGKKDSTGKIRSRNCHGYMFEDIKGTVRNDLTLQTFGSKTGGRLEDWLQALECEDICQTNFSSNSFVWMRLCCPVRVEEPKNGICKAGIFDELDDKTYHETVKAAETSFALLKFDAKSDSSVVLCRPATGRTHQIRLHLQYLGHPIANDPNYGGSMWYCNPMGVEACTNAQKMLDGLRDCGGKNGGNTSKGNVRKSNSNGTSETSLVTTDTPATPNEVERATAGKHFSCDETDECFFKRTCVWCARGQGATNEERNRWEFLVRSQGIWLHALRYSFSTTNDTVTFTSKQPPWILSPH